MNKTEALVKLATRVTNCTECKLHATRTNVVFGYGNIDAKVMFIGEAPGAAENKQGLPFVGDCGQFLTDVIEKGMKMKREDVFITNLVKCRPSIHNGAKNRPPDEAECLACCGYLVDQIKIIQPKVIMCLGSFASKFILKTTEKITKIRGRVHNYMGIPVVPTYHPSYVKNYGGLEAKAGLWFDVKLVLEVLKDIE